MISRTIILSLFCFALYAQKPTTCNITAVPVIVHAEGVAERLGDIVLTCTGSPGVTVSGNLEVLLPATITNRINAGGFAIDANLTIQSGGSSMPSGILGLVANQNISFNGFSFTLPASGQAALVIDDLRANVTELAPGVNAPVQAYLGGTLLLSNNPVVVAYAETGLLATSMDSGVTCVGSPTPSTLSLSNLFAAKTTEQTTRVTEGFPTSFQPKDPLSDTGTRFMLTYSGFPSTAAIFVPDAVAGSSALAPTSGGDLGTPPRVGLYEPGSQTLLLVRVMNPNPDGSGGLLATLPKPGANNMISLNGANPVPLSGGAGFVVYEVAAADPSATESAEIPNFYGIPPQTAPASASGGLSLAPISSVATASPSAPIPRFIATPPPSDCQVVGDCNASYYPQLSVTTSANPFTAVAVAGGKKVIAGNIFINNVQGGALDWAAGVTYGSGSGSGWLSFTQQFGIDFGIVQVVIDPAALTPGNYQAAVNVNGGIGGSQSVPLNLTVNAPAITPVVSITGVTNAANFATGPVVPGSLATVWGSNLGGQSVTVTFNGTSASVLYDGAGQINLRVPPSLAGQSSAQMVVTVDGIGSSPYTVQLTAIAPAIFTPGVLNQDNTVNSAGNPAPVGTILQVFGTGMPDSGAAFTVSIGGQSNLTPVYAGAAPGLPGVEQVNVAVPMDLPAGSANLIICVAVTGGQPACSQSEAIAIKP